MSTIDKYRDELENNFNNNVIVRIIHKNRDMCFNSYQEEILFAISECFHEYNPKIDTIYKNSFLGKALIIKLPDVPSVPPFQNILNKYKKWFFERLDFIEKDFNDDVLIQVRKEKEKLKKDIFKFSTDNKYRICQFIDLPSFLIDQVMSYVYFDISPYLKLREKYVALEYIDN